MLSFIYYILYLTFVIGLVSNNFSLSIAPPYVFDLYLLNTILSYEQHKIWYSCLYLIHEYEYMMAHIMGFI
jgi:hypothetical protein